MSPEKLQTIVGKLSDALAWYALNNSWQEYGTSNQYHPKIRDCGKIAVKALLDCGLKEDLLIANAKAAGWELDISPETEMSNFILDRNGREIMVGDTLKLFHFIGPRKKRYYMYKYVESLKTRESWGKSDAFIISHLNPTEGSFLKMRGGQQWMDCEIVQGYGEDKTPFDQRPKTPPNK